ncbi:MAG: hypothetical protein ACI93R_004298 [Flavobacteriales bacterium]|jgi:hypothetical protein
MSKNIERAVKRKKMAGTILGFSPVLIISLYFLRNDILANMIAEVVFATMTVSFFALSLSWVFVKCPDCKQLYFASWRNSPPITNGCRVCGK